jgi:hypothetical protein
MSEPSETDGQVATAPILCLVGHPGAFLDWGTAVIADALARAGLEARIELLAHAELGDAAPRAARLLQATGPVVSRPELGPAVARTLVLLDDPARAFRESIGRTADPADSVRALSSLLAPLADLLRQPETVLIERPTEGDAAALRRRIVAAALPGLEVEDTDRDIELAPAPRLGPIGRQLLRQVIRPMHDFATGAGLGPITLPLACFYGADPAEEQAPPLSDAAGPGRAVYYGPYMHMPRGRWRIEAECFFSQELCKALIAVDVFTDTVLARAEFQPPAEGHFKVVFRASVPDPAERLEVRLWVVRGVIGGMIGLRHVTWHHEGEGAGR